MTPQPVPLPEMLTETEVADLLACSPVKLRRWRIAGEGPPFRRLGGSIRYERHELTAWVQRQPSGGEAA